MTTYQNALEYAQDQMKQGKINADQANVLIVQMMGFRVIVGKLPSQVRKALNAAVKNGELERLKAEGLKPEIYHHKNARSNAKQEQQRIAMEAIDKLKKVFV
jgi:hypothetical protein